MEPVASVAFPRRVAEGGRRWIQAAGMREYRSKRLESPEYLLGSRGYHGARVSVGKLHSVYVMMTAGAESRPTGRHHDAQLTLRSSITTRKKLTVAYTQGRSHHQSQLCTAVNLFVVHPVSFYGDNQTGNITNFLWS